MGQAGHNFVLVLFPNQNAEVILRERGFLLVQRTLE